MLFTLTGWSDPRLTKTWATPASHNASKKAKEAVYMLEAILTSICQGESKCTHLGVASALLGEAMLMLNFLVKLLNVRLDVGTQDRPKQRRSVRRREA
jgi:hypothetical protein